jgi:hypothetical protein
VCGFRRCSLVAAAAGLLVIQSSVQCSVSSGVGVVLAGSAGLVFLPNVFVVASQHGATAAVRLLLGVLCHPVCVGVVSQPSTSTFQSLVYVTRAIPLDQIQIHEIRFRIQCQDEDEDDANVNSREPVHRRGFFLSLFNLSLPCWQKYQQQSQYKRQALSRK